MKAKHEYAVQFVLINLLLVEYELNGGNVVVVVATDIVVVVVVLSKYKILQ